MPTWLPTGLGDTSMQLAAWHLKSSGRRSPLQVSWRLQKGFVVKHEHASLLLAVCTSIEPRKHAGTDLCKETL